MDTTPRCIVLKNKSGKKRNPFSAKSTPYKLEGGEILECLPESEQSKDPKMIALRVIPTSSCIKLECTKRDVSQLTDSEADLLIAVSPRKERLRIYRDKNFLTEAQTLNVGSKVFVKRRKQNTDRELRGVIHYKGNLPTLANRFVTGTMFGVELLDKESEGCGNTDGTYFIDEKRYFTCPADRGVFVAVHRLRLRQDQDQEEYVGQKSDGRLAELVTSLDEGRKIREEVERRLHSSEQRSHELEFSFPAERQSHQETERRLRSNEQISNELLPSLAAETHAHQETERRFRSKEQRLNESVTSLAPERQARQKTERRLRSYEQKLAESETSLAEERQARQKTERRLRSYEQRLEESKTSLAAETQAHQETERRLQSSEERLHELEVTLTTVRQAYEDYRRSMESTRDWVVRRDEIRLSGKVIGVGAWGEVKEGTFRGCKVAVKKIHQLILSDHNRRLFEREMKMASRCRHPCLLQFIGATNDDQSPLFVTELLDTSLRAVLHDRPLEPPEITTIALDVAKGLNYLHLSHPAPIIHRDIIWKHVTIWRAKVSDYGTANFLQQSMTACPGAVIDR